MRTPRTARIAARLVLVAAAASLLAACGDPCPPHHYVTLDGDRIHCGRTCIRYELSPRYEATGLREWTTVSYLPFVSADADTVEADTAEEVAR